MSSPTPSPATGGTAAASARPAFGASGARQVRAHVGAGRGCGAQLALNLLVTLQSVSRASLGLGAGKRAPVRRVWPVTLRAASVGSSVPLAITDRTVAKVRGWPQASHAQVGPMSVTWLAAIGPR